MNLIDLVVLVILAYAVFDGWRQGLIVQVCSILGLLVGIWIASQYGAAVGNALHIGGDYAAIVGFIVVLVVVIIVVALLSRIIKRLFGFVGLGIIDVALGVALSVCKLALILSLLFSAFNGLNKEMKIVKQTTLNNSMCYKPLVKLSSKIFPALEWTQKQISSGLEKL